MKNRITCLSAFLLIFSALTTALAQNAPTIRIDFSADSPEGNNLTVTSPGFGEYPMGEISFGTFGLADVNSELTDNRGATITVPPGTGVLVMGPAVMEAKSAIVRCNFYADGPEAAITIGGIDQGPYTYVSTNSPFNGAVFQGGFQRLAVLVQPPSVGFIPLFQVYNPSETRTVTVFVDNFDIYLLDEDVCYPGEFLDQDLDDPVLTNPTPTVSIPTPTPTISVPQPTPTPPAGGGNTITVTGNIIDVFTQMPVVDATVTINGQTTTTDGQGNFSLVIIVDLADPAATASISITKAGYTDFEVVYPASLLSTVPLNVPMVPSEIPVPTIPTIVMPTEPMPTATIPGGFPTPTPVIPTPTSPPSGAAVGLKLVVCDPTVPVSLTNRILTSPVTTVAVHLIDASGEIVNPGVEGGDAGRMVTVNVTGSALINGNGDSESIFVDSSEGGTFSLLNTAVETVILTASTPGLNDAVPVTVQFVPAGAMQGTLRIWNGETFVVPGSFTTLIPMLFQETRRRDFDGLVENYKYNIDVNGVYTISGLLPGTYNVKFVAPEPLPIVIPIPGFYSHPLEPVCITSINVTAGQITQDVNFDLPAREYPGRVYGEIRHAEGGSIRFNTATVTLTPLNLTGDCGVNIWTLPVIDLSDSSEQQLESLLFDLSQIPPGQYHLTCEAYGEEEQFTYGTGIVVDLSTNSEQNIDIEVLPAVEITYLTPVNYEKVPVVSGQISQPFQWSVPDSAPPMTFNLYVYDQCGNEIASQKNINGFQSSIISQISFDPSNIYYWSVEGISSDGTVTTYASYSEGSAEPVFLIEGTP